MIKTSSGDLFIEKYFYIEEIPEVELFKTGRIVYEGRIYVIQWWLRQDGSKECRVQCLGMGKKRFENIDIHAYAKYFENHLNSQEAALRYQVSRSPDDMEDIKAALRGFG